MKQTINHPTYGEIVYDESFWTGKKSLTVNGVPAKRVKKNIYALDGNNIIINGNFTFGVSVVINNDNIEITPKAKWYEILLAGLPFIFSLTWGNSVELCAIFPMLGGALGALLGACAGTVSMTYMKKSESAFKKVLIGVLVTVVAVLISYLAACFIKAGLSAAAN